MTVPFVAADDMNAGRVLHVQSTCRLYNTDSLSDDHLDKSPLHQVWRVSITTTLEGDRLVPGVS